MAGSRSHAAAIIKVIMLKTLHIDESSPLIGDIKPGDILVSINGTAVRDQLDYLFLSADEELELIFSRGGERFIIELEKDFDDSLGLTFPEMKPRTCGNDCVFCFVDQFPPGARKTLCVKDEDYRFSFLHGNFITLSNIGKAGIARILRYRLSPLYISVHAMDSDVRNRMLGRKKDDGFLDKFRRLSEGGITMHTQVVIVPGYNDGDVLEDTIEKLSEYFPQTASIGLIPIGLTKHRRNLPELRLLEAGECRKIIETAESCRNNNVETYGDPLVYCADEMFLKAGVEIPRDEYYGYYPQIENGVGLVRHFLEYFDSEKDSFPTAVSPAQKILLVSGESIAPVLEDKIVSVLNNIDGLTVSLVKVTNKFFGESVTVSGLLTGNDIADTVQDTDADLVVLPPDCLNFDDLFLDGMSIDEFSGGAGCEVIKYDWSFMDVLALLQKSS